MVAGNTLIVTVSAGGLGPPEFTDPTCTCPVAPGVNTPCELTLKVFAPRQELTRKFQLQAAVPGGGDGLVIQGNTPMAANP